MGVERFSGDRRVAGGPVVRLSRVRAHNIPEEGVLHLQVWQSQRVAA